jgi:hypothetical protein
VIHEAGWDRGGGAWMTTPGLTWVPTSHRRWPSTIAVAERERRTASPLREPAFSRPGLQIPLELLNEVRAMTFHSLTTTTQAAATM